jgi:putative nucleotidyltransferase with HDIG domain
MVAGLAGAFAKHLGWSKADCQEVIAGGLLHDIGKMRIPLTILDKANKLTDAERAIIDKHPMFGREILKPRLEVSVDIKKMAIQHHEFLDGSGYPDGLKGDRISPKVRLMTICDIFTALTETRSYKDGMPVRAAIGVMLEMGKKLDQVMLKQFAQMVLDRDFGEVSRQPQKVKGTSAF